MLKPNSCLNVAPEIKSDLICAEKRMQTAESNRKLPQTEMKETQQSKFMQSHRQNLARLQHSGKRNPNGIAFGKTTNVASSVSITADTNAIIQHPYKRSLHLR